MAERKENAEKLGISMETAGAIWNAYREINAAHKLLADMEKASGQGLHKFDTLHDHFGRRRGLQLGVPSGDSSNRLLDVCPEVATAVIEAHIAKQRGILRALRATTAAELDEPDRKSDPVSECPDCFLPLTGGVCSACEDSEDEDD